MANHKTEGEETNVSSLKKHGLFKKRRGGELLTREEIKEIKDGRKLLRKRLREAGIKDKKDFELTASSLGLYFDKNKKAALLGWFLQARGGWTLLTAAVLLLVSLFGISIITTMRGHFTINMSRDMFREGFTLSETRDFRNPTGHLICTPAENVPCKSIADLPYELIEGEGAHHDTYFAYSYFIRNEGNEPADYKWEIMLNSESQDLSSAVWVMVFEDDKMMFYAKKSSDGTPESLPHEGDNRHGYLTPPLYDLCMDQSNQYEIARQTSTFKEWRIIPKPFLTDNVVTNGIKMGMEPGEIHKYTVVMWLEGDDPDCHDELIGGHLGLEVYMSMLEERAPSEKTGWLNAWRDFWTRFKHLFD